MTVPLYTYVFWTLHFSQDAGRTGSVCGVAWFWSWLVAWMMSSTIPTFSAGHCWHTLARRILYFKAECHENEQTRYLYITRNPRYFKRLTFPQSQNQFGTKKNFTLIYLEEKKRFTKARGSISPQNIFSEFIYSDLRNIKIRF